MPKRSTYAEGDVFAVPLRRGGFGTAVVCRRNDRGIVLLRFFAATETRQDSESSLVEQLRPEESILVGRVGALGIESGDWKKVGRIVPWSREQWGNTSFARYQELTGTTYLVRYADDDPGEVLSETEVLPGPAEQHPSDGLMGSGFAEIALTNLISGSSFQLPG